MAAGRAMLLPPERGHPRQHKISCRYLPSIILALHFHQQAIMDSPALKNTTDLDRSTAVTRVRSGESTEAVASCYGVHRSTVQRWVVKDAAKNTTADDVIPSKADEKKPSTARHRATRKYDRKLLAVVRNNPTISIKDAMALCNYPAGEQTARKRIKESNVVYLGPKSKKPKLVPIFEELDWHSKVRAIDQELKSTIDFWCKETD